MTFTKYFSGIFGALLLWCSVSTSGVAQERAVADSLEAPSTITPRVSYGLSAGAGFSNWGSMTYIEPRVQYRVTPRFHVFSSLTMLQTWGGPSFRSASTGETNRNAVLGANPDRQYLLHVGGTYAMTERLLVSGSVWKNLQPQAVANRFDANPFSYGRYPNQGFQFKAQYQVAPNVTISGGVRYGSGGNPYGYGAYPGAGFDSPWL